MNKYTRISLLEFAIRHIKKTNDELRVCHTNGRTGIVDDPDVEEEVNAVDDWITQAKQELKILKGIDALLKRATLTMTVKRRVRRVSKNAR